MIGLDFFKAASYFNLKNKDMVLNEQEIILGTLLNQKIIFNGKSKELDNYL